MTDTNKTDSEQNKNSSDDIHRTLQLVLDQLAGLQLVAVEQNWEAIKHIKNPSEAVQLSAVQVPSDPKVKNKP